MNLTTKTYPLMCGISGFYSPNQAFSDDDLHNMTNALAHRGPDSEGYFNDGLVGLGHKRLSILDLSNAANQPMTSACNQYEIVYNGEVYNFKEISKELDIEFRTGSDTEVVLESYVKWGAACLSKFNGMFAIAIYDKIQKTLFLARDRIGIKPLYYHWDGRNLAFASESKALVTLPIDNSLDMQSLADYLFLEYVPHTRSIFNSLNKLPPGHYLVADSGGIVIHEYYNLLEKINPSNSSLKNINAEFEEQLSKSVSLRKIGDVPLGTFLSGGTDSSLITAVLQANTDTPVATFSIGFDVSSYDESPYAAEVSKLLNTNSHMFSINESESISLASKLADYYDEPFAAESAIPSMLICKKARENVTIALSGDGGDELFMGYGYYKWHDRIAQIRKYGGNFGRKTAVAILSLLGNREQRAARVLDYQPWDSMWLHIWSQEQSMFSEREISSLLGNNYQHQTLNSDWEQIDKLPLRGYEKISLFDIKHYLANNLLYKMDIASMASSLEVRVPFLDHNLVEFAINLPFEIRAHGSTQKYLLKKTLERYLPKRLIYRKKWGFPAPIGHWLKGEMKFLIDKYLDKRVLKKQDIFSPKMVNDLLTEFYKGKDYHYKRIWSLIVFQMWYEKYIERL